MRYYVFLMRYFSNDVDLSRFVAKKVKKVRSDGVVLRHETLLTLQKALDDAKSRLEDNFILQKPVKSLSGTVYSGLAGVALALDHVRKSEDERSQTAALVKEAAERRQNKWGGFYCTDSGALAVAAILDNTTDYVQEFLGRFHEEVDSDEVLYGRAGLLWAGLQLLQRASMPLDQETLLRYHLKRLCDVIIRNGLNESGSLAPPIWNWHGKMYLGAAHGVAGILTMLIRAKDLLSLSQLELVLDGVVDAVARWRLPSGNFRSSESSASDELVQWCHGAPGFLLMMVEAIPLVTFSRKKALLTSAEEAANVIWDRGFLVKGLGLCHGVCGNGYALLSLWRVSGREEYYFKALRLGLVAARWRAYVDSKKWSLPDRPLSLMEGLAGAMCFWHDLIQSQEQRNYILLL